MEDVGAGRVLRWDMGGELKDKSLATYLTFLFLFLFLFLPQMNWVSITGQVWGRLGVQVLTDREFGLVGGLEKGHSVTFRTVGGF